MTSDTTNLLGRSTFAASARLGDDFKRHAPNAAAPRQRGDLGPAPSRETPAAPARHIAGLLAQGGCEGLVAPKSVDDLVAGHAAHHRHFGDIGKHKAASAESCAFWHPRHMKTGKQPKSSELRHKLGERLLAARTAYHPNRAAVARALDVDHRVLAKYEAGDRYPDEAFIVRFADLTGCPLDFLYRGLITSEMDPLLSAGIAAAAPHLVDEAVEAAKAARSKRVAALLLE